jgi:hypothetical protein
MKVTGMLRGSYRDRWRVPLGRFFALQLNRQRMSIQG